MEAKGLTNQYLEKLSRKILPKSFLGVFPCDVFPNTRRRKSFSIIFNTGSSLSEGEHFIAIFVSDKNILFFDSFGEPISNDFIKNFLLNFNNFYYMYDSKIQDDQSNFCGFYCLAFLMNLYKNGDTHKFISKFQQGTNLMMNDKKIVKFIINEM